MNRGQKLAIIALTSLALLTGCGGNTSNQGQLNNTGPGVFGPGSCAPLGVGQGGGGAGFGANVGFSGQNVYVDSANIVGGTIPYSFQSVGQMYAGQTGGGSFGQYYGYGLEGEIYLDITYGQAPFNGGQQPYQNYPQQNTFQPHPVYGNYGGWQGGASSYANVQGTVVVYDYIVQQVLAYYGSWSTPYYGNNWFNNQFNTNGTQQQFNQFNNAPCVSGFALNVGVWGQTIYGGSAYMYLNGATNGFSVYF